MESKELRIGNWIYIRDIEDTIDISIEFDYDEGNFYIDGRHIDYINPIPLTEEWLLKFGFFKGMYYSIGISKEGELLEISFKHKHTCISLGDSISIKNVEYVHQLQNLYFALTGEELIIKES